MNKYINAKYLFFFFLLVNLTAEYVLFANVSRILFYVILILCVPVLFVNYYNIKRGFYECPYLFIWIAIYCIYQFTVGLKYISFENLTYLIAKITSFCTLIYCVKTDLKFYCEKSFYLLGLVIVFLLILGLIHPCVYGLKCFGFYNKNAACSIAAVGFACFLFKNTKINKYDVICIFVCILCVLIGGSRNSLAMIIILALIRCNISLKSMLPYMFFIFIILFIMQLSEIHFLAIDRTIGTIKGTVALDREIARKAAFWMISQHPWDGNGFKISNVGDALEMTDLGSHNGYIDIIENMGYGFGGLWLLVLACGIISLKKLLNERKHNIKIHIGITISILFAANHESFLPGVNQFVTNMFYLSFVVLHIYKYTKYSQLVREY